MPNFKDRVTKDVEDIYNTISNEEERAKVIKSVQNLITEFTTHLVNLSEFQNELESQVVDLQEAVLDIQSQLGEDGADDSMDTCPYCGQDIFVSLDNGSHEFECPNCHNIIEIEEDNDEDGVAF